MFVTNNNDTNNPLSTPKYLGKWSELFPVLSLKEQMWLGLCGCVVLRLGRCSPHQLAVLVLQGHNGWKCCALKMPTVALPSIFLLVACSAERASIGSVCPWFPLESRGVAPSSLAGIFWEWVRSFVAWTLIIKGGHRVRGGSECCLVKERIGSKGVKVKQKAIWGNTHRTSWAG